jgi:putative glutathione S-transferase
MVTAMGRLVDGVWQPGALVSTTTGAYVRDAALLRGRVGTPEHPIAPGRYHLYAAYACPWAHRTLITRALRGLADVVGVTFADPHLGEHGWEIPGGYLHEIYTRSDPHYTGKVTVPVLFDQVAGKIVANESRDIMRMFDLDFAPIARDPIVATLAPPHLLAEIDATLDALYPTYNNGVYRAGFARAQHAYEAAVRDVFAALAHWDAVLATRPFLCGDAMTEADVALFTTSLRFDLVYYSHFKCNLRRLRDHANVWRVVCAMWRVPAIRATCDLDSIKTHYYWSQDSINPSRIVPLGPDLLADLDQSA